ncbi:MAG: glutaredoxin [Anaerolineae bacterium]|nr:MAG: glutaredoxin [Anaerolineae bacterium]
MLSPITLYGSTNCEDTEQTRRFLLKHGIPFSEINIDDDKQAEHFVIFINRGYRSTPTVVIGEGKMKIILTEPTDGELVQILKQAGYSLNSNL